MTPFFSIEGPRQSLHILGVKLVGVNAETGTKVALTLALCFLILLLGAGLRRLARYFGRLRQGERERFWMRQLIQLFLAVVLLIGILSIWFDDPSRLSTGLGLVTAGLAFALQKVVLSFAGYLVILRGKTFNVGDRITMGGVRGDVIALGFMQTQILEMGQPPEVQNADPAMWVKSRQPSGRIVSVSNSRIFDNPVYNYSKEFPYIWEEMILPLSYRDNRGQAEQILLDAAERHTRKHVEEARASAQELERRYHLTLTGLTPKVYLRLTDNWIELSVRFLVPVHAIREIKDAISREILERLQSAGIGIASATFEIVGMPPLRIEDTTAQNGVLGESRKRHGGGFSG